MKRTKYVVHVGADVARFSKLQHAYLFAEYVSARYPDHLIEVVEPPAQSCEDWFQGLSRPLD